MNRYDEYMKEVQEKKKEKYSFIFAFKPSMDLKKYINIHKRCEI